MEETLYVLIVSLISHPDTDWYDKSQLLTECNFFWKNFRSCRTECHLILLFIYFKARRHTRCDIKNSSICQRHTDLKSGCCTHLINIQVNITFQPDLNIYIRHLCQRIKTFCLLVDSSCKFDWQYVWIVFLKNLLLLVFFHDIGISNIEILQILTITFCVSVHIITTEEFVRTLSGITDLRMFCCCVTSKCKYNRRCISKRLLHIVHYIRYNIKELLRSNDTSGEFSSKKLCCLLCKNRFIKSFLFITTGICLLCVRHCKYIGRINSARQE